MQELNLIEFIRRRAGKPHSLLSRGIGDDCAVFNQQEGTEWVITTDMLVENVHFDLSWHEPYLLGRKALAVNLSDIAAMGGDPQFVLLSLAIPGSINEEWIKIFMDGAFSQMEPLGCSLIGGDTVAATHLTISVTVLGNAPTGKSICRDRAEVGDAVFVSGPLGSAAAGLYLAKEANGPLNKNDIEGWSRLLGRHLNPTPRVELGKVLISSGMVNAMQDISDGVATDLSHICKASGVGATIQELLLPAEKQLHELCSARGLSDYEFQISGGEDYELLFTVPKEYEAKLMKLVHDQTGDSIYKIGEIVDGGGVKMLMQSGESINIDYKGYEHTS